MNRQERGGKAREIADRLSATIPDAKYFSERYARTRLQVRIATRIATRAEEGIGTNTRPVARNLPGKLGENCAWHDVSSVANGSKFQTNKDRRIMSRLAKQFAEAEALIKQDSL